MYSMAASVASDKVEPQFYSHTPDMIDTEPALVLFLIVLQKNILGMIYFAYYIFVLTMTLFCDFQL